MPMVSMKTEGDNDRYCSPSSNKYGYGLCISLTEEQVEALGLKANPPAAGSQIGIRAVATVVSVTQDADTDCDEDGIDVTLRFQITDMEVTGSPATSAASLLYSE